MMMTAKCFVVLLILQVCSGAARNDDCLESQCTFEDADDVAMLQTKAEKVKDHKVPDDGPAEFHQARTEEAVELRKARQELGVVRVLEAEVFKAKADEKKQDSEAQTGGAVGFSMLCAFVLVVFLSAGFSWWSIAGASTVKERTQWSVKIVVFLALFADFLLMTMPIPILPKALSCKLSDPQPALHPENCVSDSLIFILFASKAAVQLVANPFVAHAVDERGPGRPLLMSLIFMAVSTAAFSFGLWVNSEYAVSKTSVIYPMLISARAVQGIASSGAMCAGMSLVSFAHPSEERGAATGFVMTGLALGVTSGPVIGGVLSQYFASWVGFLLVAALILVGCILQAAFLGDITAIEESGSDDDALEDPNLSYSVYTDPLVLSVGACILLTTGSISLLEPLVPLYLSRWPFWMGPQNSALVWSCATLAYIFSTVLAGILADSFPKWALLALGLLLLALGVGIVVAVKMLGMTIAGLVLCGLSLGFVDTPATPLLTEILDYRGSKNYARAFAVSDIATCLACILGPVIASLAKLFHARYIYLMWALSLVCVLLIPVIVRLRIIDKDQEASNPLRLLGSALGKSVHQ